MNGAINNVYRMVNGRLVYIEKYVPKKWWHRHIAEIIAYCVFSLFIGCVIAFIIANLFMPIPPCPQPSEWTLK